MIDFNNTIQNDQQIEIENLKSQVASMSENFEELRRKYADAFHRISLNANQVRDFFARELEEAIDNDEEDMTFSLDDANLLLKAIGAKELKRLVEWEVHASFSGRVTFMVKAANEEDANNRVTAMGFTVEFDGDGEWSNTTDHDLDIMNTHRA